MILISPLEFSKNEARNMVWHLLAVDPPTPTKGQVWYNTTANRPKYFDGTVVKDLTDALTFGGQGAAYFLSRANATGTQLAATISDFDAAVRASRLDQMAAPASDVSLNSRKLTSVANPVSAQDAATKAYVDGAVVGLLDDRGNYDASANTFPAAGGSGAAGAVLKGDIWIVSVGGTLGGVAVTVGDQVRALVDAPAQVAANWAISKASVAYVAENAANKDTDGTFAANSDTKYPSQKAAKTYVDAGLATKQAALGFVPPMKYSATVGNGVLTTIIVTQATHGCAANRTNSVFCLEEATGIKVEPDVTQNANGDVVLAFSVAPTANQYRVTIMG